LHGSKPNSWLVLWPIHERELAGKALALYRYEVVITTKFGFRIRNGKEAALDSRPEHIKNAVEGSLKRLGVETMLGWQGIWQSS
jgi:aryl-alcohol dehydrogenase-like predicted oxidoreductase